MFSGLALGCFLLVINAEYFGGFGVVVRTVLFFGLLFAVLGLAWFLSSNLTESCLRLGKMSDQEAASVDWRIACLKLMIRY
jgi:hypothetical protein